MKLSNKTHWVPIIVTVITIALLGLGLLAGRYMVIRPFKKQIRSHYRCETLGGFLSDKRKKRAALAYYDSDKVAEEMDNFSWAVPNVPTPFVGNAPKPGKHNNASINSMQLRVENEVLIPKPSNVYRIFMTGGSTAYGSGAPDQQRTIAGYLEKILNEKLNSSTNKRYEVLTAANPAWASTHERIMIENRLSELEPDMVISFSGNNDVHWGYKGRNILWFRAYADDFFLGLINRAYKISGYGNLVDVPETEPLPADPSLVAARIVKNVTLSSYVLSLKKAKYFFFLQPTLAVSKKGLTDNERRLLDDKKEKDQKEKAYFLRCYASMNSRLKDLKIDNFRFVNLSDMFDDMGEKEHIFLDSYHFGDKGNELAARNIFRQIKPVIYH
ncbi:MAG: hypothetical protein JRJ86_17130 [Deltaproteobacteria bacterium]|nr:hypothetical protein [Deltaproteobacteria bacterium]MBW2344641.1 hypothetical protein [Deltaproteobacteria bacterium]